MDRAQFLKELQQRVRQFEELKPELEVTLRDPEMGVEGYIVVWTTLAARGGPLGRIGKGGTRATPTVSLDEVGTLARTMALKNAAAGLPLGGAKSGIRADPDAPDFEMKLRRFVTLAKPLLRENGGPFGGFGFDVGMRPITAQWVCDELKSFASFTGKPLEMGGTDYDREGIAGLGVVTATRSAFEFRGETLRNKHAAVQGLGAMGSAVVRYLLEEGAHIASISDPRIGGTYRLTPSLCERLLPAIIKGELSTVRELLQGEPILPLDAVLYEEVDCLFPSALQAVITRGNESHIRAKMVIEAANNPCTDEARAALAQRQVDVLPDFIVNPGGIIAAFVEMTSRVPPAENAVTRQNVLDAKALARERISLNVRRMLELAATYHVSPIEAGRFLALSNIFQSVELSR